MASCIAQDSLAEEKDLKIKFTILADAGYEVPDTTNMGLDEMKSCFNQIRKNINDEQDKDQLMMTLSMCKLIESMSSCKCVDCKCTDCKCGDKSVDFKTVQDELKSMSLDEMKNLFETKYKDTLETILTTFRHECKSGEC